MHYIYILENLQGRIYIGSSSNVEKRLESHNKNKGPDWTQGKGPWKLIYKENFPSGFEALEREILKKLKGLKEN